MGISAPEARAMILNQMLEQQGLILSDEIINQFATGLITLQDALSQAVGAGAGGAALREGFTEPLQSIDQTVGAEIGRHTAELQSQASRVCRRLLEKKKKPRVDLNEQT